MKKTNFHKYLRIIYYIFSLLILFFSVHNLLKGSIKFYDEDVIFLFFLMISLILVNKYSIQLKSTKLNFNDFLIIILYVKFGTYISIILLFVCYLIIAGIEYKGSKNQNFLTENIFIFNNVLVILSVYFSYLFYNYIDYIYFIRDYEILSAVVFSTAFLTTNYILFCLDLSFEKNKIILITLQDGLYYILLNYTICSIMAVFSLFLYNQYGYLPTVIVTIFIILTSFTLNNLNNLNSANNNLKAISQCSIYLLSKVDFKIKLNHVIHVIENIVPFVYCGIYFFRKNYDKLYPICYKSNSLTDLESTIFYVNSEEKFFEEISSGNVVVADNIFYRNSLKLSNITNNDIKYILSIPIKNLDSTVGFITVCISQYKELKDETKLLCDLGHFLGMVSFNVDTAINNNIINYKNYDGLTRYIDYNIKNKIFFTLALIEISNYDDIIKKYNSDFYEAFKAHMIAFINKFLSPLDAVMCFEKENIYIVFNLLDSKNTNNKLEEIEKLLVDFKFINIDITPNICFSTCEYPIEGINGDEVLSVVYRNLQNKKTSGN